MSVFPFEIFKASRRWVETRFSDLRYWNTPPHGGHFAALEQPELLAQEIRACFKTMI
jgi:pimeloyl-ACP methyl ester carboxylesterase